MTVGFSSANYSVSESDEVCNVSLELTEAAEREVTVLIQTGNGTATGSLREGMDFVASVDVCLFSPAPSDYSAVSQEVIFPAGTTQRSVAIPITGNSVLEDIEFFYVKMSILASQAEVVLLGTDAATISITDDDSKWVHKSTKQLHKYLIVDLAPNWWFLSRCDDWILIKCISDY